MPTAVIASGRSTIDAAWLGILPAPEVPSRMKTADNYAQWRLPGYPDDEKRWSWLFRHLLN
ncbi:MAG: hypothetical protein ACM3ZC_00210 [Bacteroidota bacterium]